MYKNALVSIKKLLRSNILGIMYYFPSLNMQVLKNTRFRILRTWAQLHLYSLIHSLKFNWNILQADGARFRIRIKEICTVSKLR